jgi:hypothetical protein
MPFCRCQHHLQQLLGAQRAHLFHWCVRHEASRNLLSSTWLQCSTVFALNLA